MTVDYISANFPDKILPKIQDWLTYNLLKKLKNIIKVNGTSVVSNLGGGAHGHLRLVIPELEYSKIIGTTNKKIQHPGELKIKENTALHDTIILRELHNEKLQIFREKTAVKAALKSLIIAAINSIYLKELKNITTETITFTIPYIFTYLFQRYNEVSSQHLGEEEQNIREMAYNINNPHIVVSYAEDRPA